MDSGAAGSAHASTADDDRHPADPDIVYPRRHSACRPSWIDTESGLCLCGVETFPEVLLMNPELLVVSRRHCSLWAVLSCVKLVGHCRVLSEGVPLAGAALTCVMALL